MARKYHEEHCISGMLNPVTEWAGDNRLVIVAYECPQCKKRTPVSEMGDTQNVKGSS